MKITKHGKKADKVRAGIEEFSCEKCGCEFEAKEDEYYVDNDSSGWNGYLSTTYISTSKTYVCSCPECHKIVRKVKYVPGYKITCNGSSVTNTFTVDDKVSLSGTDINVKSNASELKGE